MKIFSFIFAVYFFALATMPCGDEAFVGDNCKITTCIHIETSPSEEHHADLCSPLCMCSCCGGVTIVSNSDNNLISPMLSEKLSIYNSNSPSEISFSIWQPPKV